jgi:hypothetical protein
MRRGPVSFEVKGLRQVDQALRLVSTATAKSDLRTVGRAALVPFDKAWRAKAPVDEASDGPHLKDSGGIGSTLTRSQEKVRERISAVEVFAGPGGHAKAVQQEFGNEHNPPQPYARPSWEETKDQVLDLTTKGLWGLIEKIAKRLERQAKSGV